jgi:polyamine oxidase
MSSSTSSSALVLAAAVLLALTIAQHGSLAAAAGPNVIIVGAGISGKHAYMSYQPHMCPDLECR